MTVNLATSDSEIVACGEVMRELRPHISAESFVARVQKQECDGYQIAYVATDDDRIVAVAGFRVGVNLAWGRFLYVDDLVTAARARSQGHGGTLLKWLHEYAKKQSCDELHLDSGIQRLDAHRFYKREGMEMTSFHFQTKLEKAINS